MLRLGGWLGGGGDSSQQQASTTESVKPSDDDDGRRGKSQSGSTAAGRRRSLEESEPEIPRRKYKHSPRFVSGLDEVNAPQPLDPESEQHEETLEDREDVFEEAQQELEHAAGQHHGHPGVAEQGEKANLGLTELDAPQPLDSNSQDRSSEDLETAQGETSFDGEKNGRSFRPRTKPMAYIYDRWAFLATSTWLIFFSIWAVLARLGLSALEGYLGHIIFPLIWPQFVGCVIIGFAQETKPYWPQDEHTLAIYIGITTGFCGSLTSFSSWVFECSLALANLNPYYPRPRGYNVLSLLNQIILTLTVSIAGLRLGAEFAVFFIHAVKARVTTKEQAKVIHGRVKGFLRYANAMSFVLALLVWIGMVFLVAFVPAWREGYTFPALIAPFGALIRWQLATFNPRVQSFPLGTFAANIISTVVLSVVVLLQLRVSTALVGCAVLNAFQQGFCGALSTISTFVVELTSLRRTHAWIYGSVSVVVGIILPTLIVGIDAWTDGWHPKCPLQM